MWQVNLSSAVHDGGVVDLKDSIFMSWATQNKSVSLPLSAFLSLSLSPSLSLSLSVSLSLSLCVCVYARAARVCVIVCVFVRACRSAPCVSASAGSVSISGCEFRGAVYLRSRAIVSDISTV